MEVVTFGAGVVPRADPITFNEVFRLVQVQRFSALVVCMNTFHFGRESTGGSESSLVVDWRDNIVPTWKSQVTNAMTFDEVNAQRIMPTPSAVAGVALSGTGSVGMVQAPCPTAGVITWRTQLIGRNRRGRTYVPGLGYQIASQVGNGVTWGTANIACLTAIGNAILTRYTLGGNPYGFQLIVWSRKIGFAGGGTDWRTGAAMVTRFTSQSYIATMGSRRGSRGI